MSTSGTDTVGSVIGVIILSLFLLWVVSKFVWFFEKLYCIDCICCSSCESENNKSDKNKTAPSWGENVMTGQQVTLNPQYFPQAAIMPNPQYSPRAVFVPNVQYTPQTASLNPQYLTLTAFTPNPQYSPKAGPILLDRNIVTEQRFMQNPQYSSRAGPISSDKNAMRNQQIVPDAQNSRQACNIPIESFGSVPLLNRSLITDLKKIGEGFFGEVYKGELHSFNNGRKRVQTVAIKWLKLQNNQALDEFLNEIEIMSSFRHPNILTLLGVCPPENSIPPWMIFEYMSFGDLANVLRNSDPKFKNDDRDLPILSEEDLSSISSQIAAGMAFFARQRFVHRDLACRNCLVGSPLKVKISDFGMSRDVYTCDYYKSTENKMLPVRWMSPESIAYGKFTLESDVWSYGVVLWEIYSYGKQPYYGNTNEQALKLISDHVHLEIPENCPTKIVDIMRSCWQINPKDRLKFSDICKLLSSSPSSSPALSVIVNATVH